MIIGVDIDGVILDYERKLRTYGELYDLLELNGKGVVNKDEEYVQNRYDWNQEQKNRFVHEYFAKLSKEVPLLPGAKDVINYLKQDGHKLIIISARGISVPEMEQLALNILEKENLKFDKYCFKAKDKLDICLKEKIDIMIDDVWYNCKQISENKIKTIYFKDTNKKTLEENDYLKEVTNWGEIYRYIKNMEV